MKVDAKDMPSRIILLSDMQFDRSCGSLGNPNPKIMELIRAKYESAGYKVPIIVFWNLSSYNNVPVTVHESGVVMVSGFSPSIMKSILKGDDKFTPYQMMLSTVMNERYVL